MTKDEVRQAISKLTAYQTERIAGEIAGYLRLNQELEDTTPRICPCCGVASRFIKKGFSGTKQRYQCKCCGKKFTYDAKQLTSWSHQSAQQWAVLIEDTLSLAPLTKVEEDLSVSHATAHHMRHKFLVFLSEAIENMPVLDEIVEADETFILESRKGTPVTDRKPRRHGQCAEQRGLSSEQMCICVAADRRNHVTAKCVNRARPTGDNILQAIGDKMELGCLFLCDGNRAYNKLVAEKNCTKIELVGHETYSKVFHLNTVNNLHSRFKKMIRSYRGVASKYLNRYTSLFSVLARLSDCSIAEMASIVRRNMKSVFLSATIDRLHSHFLLSI